jgi:hypothetical protein
VAPLPIQRNVGFPRLPWPHFSGANAHGDCTARSQRVLQRLWPEPARNEIPPIEEGLQALLAEGSPDTLNRLWVTPVVAEKDIVLGRGSISTHDPFV